MRMGVKKAAAVLAALSTFAFAPLPDSVATALWPATMTRMRKLALSPTKTLPAASTATACGALKSAAEPAPLT